jgi:hypothetical protein
VVFAPTGRIPSFEGSTVAFSLARLLELAALALDTVSVYQNYRSFTSVSDRNHKRRS